jgi:hypothetical protein
MTITTTQARKRQQQLQARGAELLKSFDLIHKLDSFGRVRATGSYSYGLMQVPDLDFKIYCKEIDQHAVRRLGGRMADRSDVVGIRLLDFTKMENAEGRGVYLNIFPYFKRELWKLDLLFLSTTDERPEHATLAARLDNLSQRERDTILTLKAKLIKTGRYSHPTIFHNSAMFHGADVYQAVLDGAKTVNDLECWKTARDSALRSMSG